jgi:hypothetical protein
MHCVFILHNPDVMKINYAPTESSTNTIHGNIAHATFGPNNAVTVQRDAWRSMVLIAKGAIATDGRQKNLRVICFHQHLRTNSSYMLLPVRLLA